MRQPGDPLPSDLLRRLRTDAGLSQEAFAKRLGLQGGKATISAWENERSTCEGPAAELVLLLFGGDPGDVLAGPARERMSTLWNRAANPISAWRQSIAYPCRALHVPNTVFSELFPRAGLTATESMFGFPFQVVSGQVVHGIASEGWIGVLPEEAQRAPQYAWLFDRSGAFLYRERRWESDPFSITSGHLHLGTLLALAQQTSHFYARACHAMDLDAATDVVLRLEFSAMRGRSVVAYENPKIPILTDPGRPWMEDQMGGGVRVPVSRLKSEPRAVGLEIVAELLGLLAPDMSSPKFLADQLGHHLAADREARPGRYLAFLDEP